MIKKLSYLLALLLITLNWGCNKDDNDTQKVVIEGLIKEIPATNNGEPWDITPEGLTSGPDVYWTISGSQDFSASTWVTDATTGQIHFTGDDFPIEVSKEETLTINFYNKNDLDTTDSGEEDELMSSHEVRIGIINESPDCPEGYYLVLVFPNSTLEEFRCCTIEGDCL